MARLEINNTLGTSENKHERACSEHARRTSPGHRVRVGLDHVLVRASHRLRGHAVAVPVPPCQGRRGAVVLVVGVPFVGF